MVMAVDMVMVMAMAMDTHIIPGSIIFRRMDLILII